MLHLPFEGWNTKVHSNLEPSFMHYYTHTYTSCTYAYTYCYSLCTWDIWSNKFQNTTEDSLKQILSTNLNLYSKPSNQFTYVASPPKLI